MASGDGSGWVECAAGHRHWGRYGAAGLLLVAPGPRVLLQLRVAWSHHGGTWGLPGGARDSAESAEQAAIREAVEETGLDPSLVTIVGTSVANACGWPYTTVLGRCEAPLAAHAEDPESDAVCWVEAAEVSKLALHPAFALAWPGLAESLPT